MEATYDPVLDDERPEKKQAYWEVAFGLQAVDGLRPSEYVRGLADEHVRGEKTYREVAEETARYYQEIKRGETGEGDTLDKTMRLGEKEADMVAEAIYGILADEAFRFDVPTFKSYHRRLFEGLDVRIYHPGEFRTVNLTKKEPILDGKSVQYQDYGMIEESLGYDFAEEKAQDYLKMDFAEKVERVATFTSRIWQVHPFYEGNTRTTAVFIEKYLMSMGYEVDNEVFYKRSREFRDALVLANYSNIPEGIRADDTKLEEFFREILAR